MSSVVVVSPDELRALIAEAVAEAIAETALPAKPNTWLTPKEAAALIGVSRSTLDALRSRGEGPPHIKIGRAVRYRREGLEQTGRVDPASALAAQTSTTQTPPAWKQPLGRGRATQAREPEVPRYSQTIPRHAPPPRAAAGSPIAVKKERAPEFKAVEYVTTKEAVKMLGIPAHTLQRLRFSVPHVRIGQTIRYRRADLLNVEAGTEPWHLALVEARERKTPRIAPEIAVTYLRDYEAAKLLGVHTGTLQALRSRDESPPYLKLGRSVRYRRADLDESGATDSTPPEATPGVRFYAGSDGWRQAIAKARQARQQRYGGASGM